MLIMARGGPQYGAIFSGSHPNVAGRAADPAKDEAFRRMLEQADQPKWR